MSLFYLTPLFLYFPIFIPDVETQPLLSVAMAIYGLIIGRNRRALYGFLSLTFLLLFWIVITSYFIRSITASLGLLQILIGPLVLFGALCLNAEPPSRKFFKWLALYFSAVAVLELLAPDIYSYIASHLLIRANVADGHRGISVFMPEPTYAAISIVYFIFLAWWSGMYWGFRHKWIESLLVIVLLATASTYIVPIVLAIALVRWPRVVVLGVLLLVAMISLLDVVALDNDQSIRSVVAISRFLAADYSNFISSISQIDSSLGTRFGVNYASFIAPIYSPFGLGLDCESVIYSFDAAKMDFMMDNPVVSAAAVGGCLKPQSYMAAIVLGLGSGFFLFCIAFLFFCGYASSRFRKASLWLPALAVAMVILIVQGQITSPIPWLLIFFSLRSNSSAERNFHSTHQMSDRVPSPA